MRSSRRGNLLLRNLLARGECAVRILFSYIGNFVPYIRTLRADAHSRETEICRKRPRSAQECALHILCPLIETLLK